MMGFFLETVNDFLFSQKRSIIGIWHGSNAEAVGQRCFVNKVVSQISGNSQEKTCNRVS